MNIQDTIKAHMKEAMYSRDKSRLTALRGIKSELVKEMKKKGVETLSDDKSIKILRMLAKQRTDSASVYTEAGRLDLAEQESFELSIIDGFLPSLAGADETRVWVKEAIDSGASNLGAVIGMVMKSHKGEADGKLVRQLAQEML